MINQAICAARSLYYKTEKRKLSRLRRYRTGYRIAVYIPTYNREDILFERALPSVLSQTYRQFVVYVVAHGCTDNTVDRVLALNNPHVRLIELERHQTYPPTAENHWLAGPVAPANEALKEVCGDWIARIDDDDEWRFDHLERLLTFAETENYEFVSSAHLQDGVPALPYNYNGVRVGGTQTWLYRSYLRFMKYNPDCWRKTDHRVNDMDLQKRFVEAGVRIGYYPHVTAEIRPRPGETETGSMVYRKNAERYEDTYEF